jgi:hypothetical protein
VCLIICGITALGNTGFWRRLDVDAVDAGSDREEDARRGEMDALWWRTSAERVARNRGCRQFVATKKSRSRERVVGFVLGGLDRVFDYRNA